MPADDFSRRVMHILDLTRPGWADQAACKGLTELFFGETTSDVRAARQVCNDCEVRTDCRDYARTGREAWGVWGGESVKERLRNPITRETRHGTVAGYEWHRRQGHITTGEICDPCQEAARIRSRENQRRRRLGITGDNNG